MGRAVMRNLPSRSAEQCGLRAPRQGRGEPGPPARGDTSAPRRLSTWGSPPAGLPAANFGTVREYRPGHAAPDGAAEPVVGRVPVEGVEVVLALLGRTQDRKQGPDQQGGKDAGGESREHESLQGCLLADDAGGITVDHSLPSGGGPPGLRRRHTERRLGRRIRNIPSWFCRERWLLLQ